MSPALVYPNSRHFKSPTAPQPASPDRPSLRDNLLAARPKQAGDIQCLSHPQVSHGRPETLASRTSACPLCHAKDGSFFLRVVVVANCNSGNSASPIHESPLAAEDEVAEVLGIVMETGADVMEVWVALEGIGGDGSCRLEIAKSQRPRMH